MNLNDEQVFEIEFTNPTGGSLGKLTFKNDKVEFIGLADQCATQFIEEVQKQWLATGSARTANG